jgi:hypothetical protein
MKLKIFLCSLLIVGIAPAYAQAATSETSSIASLSTKPSTSIVYTMWKCHFQIHDSSGGRLYISNKSSPPDGSYSSHYPGPDWGFPIACYAGASQDEVYVQLDVKQVDGKWIWAADHGMPFKPSQHFHIFKFSGKNWAGTATTYDAITGDEDTRPSFFQYCLVETHGPQVLCGRTTGSIGTVETAATRCKILAVLKTVEFVDPPPADPTGATSTSTH